MADSSGCTGTEVRRTTEVQVIVPGVLTLLRTIITYQRPDGSLCYVQSLQSASAVNNNKGTGTADPTTTHLTQNSPDNPHPDKPPWQTDDRSELGLTKQMLQLNQEALAIKQQELHGLMVNYKNAAEQLTKNVQKENDLREQILNKFGIDPNSNYLPKLQQLFEAGDYTSQEELSSLTYAYKDARNDAIDSRREVDNLQFQIDNTRKEVLEYQADVAASKRNLAKLQQQQAGQQTKAGPPPDLGPRDWTSNFKWWSSGSVGHFADNSSANTIGGLTGQAMIGGDILLEPRLSIGFGVGVHASNNDTATGSSFVNGADLLARGFWGPNDWFWFDATLSYAYSRVSEDNGGIADDFDFHQVGIGAGVNVSRLLAERWRFDGRLGWSGSLSKRAASTDSSDAEQPSTNGNFGRARADAKLTYLCDGGEVFADGALRWVTNDSTDSADRFDGELGGGFSFAVGRGMTLTGRGYTIVGHDAYEEYGASLQLTGHF